MPNTLEKITFQRWSYKGSWDTLEIKSNDDLELITVNMYNEDEEQSVLGLKKIV